MSDDDRHLCTADDPWSPEKSRRARHPDAWYIRTLSSDEGDVLECPHCGLQFVEAVYP